MKTSCVSGLVAIFMAAALASAQQSSPKLLVLNKEEGTLAIVDPESGTILGRVPVGQGPHELVTSSDGKYAFASNYGTGPAPGHTISMVDVAAHKEMPRVNIAPPSRPYRLDFAGGRLYFTAGGTKSFSSYDPSAERTARAF